MYEVIICLLAGLGAGLGTGFAGMSAAAVISPVLIAFLGTDPYTAVGIALASDVLASAASAWTYKKNGNIDVKNGLIMMLCVLLFTVVGSWIASLVPHTVMGGFSTVMTMFLGIKFIVKPVMVQKESGKAGSRRDRIVKSVICGSAVGFICGFVGAGGGMMMLLLLTSVMGYELKTAVGTSVFIMAFTAFTGSASHFAIGGLPDMKYLVLCVISTLVFALTAARIANKAKPETLNRTVGAVLVIIGVAVLSVSRLT
ncbi:MAG: sulfite exporter TauE/SafE family protein [Ruminococcus sp.]|nr:sulfite exporter TauE/SafE family protein [Ruminococcus sp.]